MSLRVPPLVVLDAASTLLIMAVYARRINGNESNQLGLLCVCCCCCICSSSFVSWMVGTLFPFSSRNIAHPPARPLDPIGWMDLLLRVL